MNKEEAVKIREGVVSDQPRGRGRPQGSAGEVKVAVRMSMLPEYAQQLVDMAFDLHLSKGEVCQLALDELRKAIERGGVWLWKDPERVPTRSDLLVGELLREGKTPGEVMEEVGRR